MRRQIPSTIMLLAFESAARRLSFTRAAEDLNLTQSAVSHQVIALENLLGVPLFLRTKRQLELTQAGQTLLARLTPALNGIESAMVEMMTNQGRGGILQLGVVPTFATKWLIPRLGEFLRQHGEITVNLATRLVPFDFSETELDATIHYGAPVWPGAQCDYLMGEEIVVVCSAEIAQTTLWYPQNLEGVTLLHQSTRPHAWLEWAEAARLPHLDWARGPRFELFSMISQAAIAGLGAAVVPRFLVADELASGKLVVPFGPTVHSSFAYYLVYPEQKAELPAVRAFRNWLLAAAQPGPRSESIVQSGFNAEPAP